MLVLSDLQSQSRTATRNEFASQDSTAAIESAGDQGVEVVFEDALEREGSGAEVAVRGPEQLRLRLDHERICPTPTQTDNRQSQSYDGRFACTGTLPQCTVGLQAREKMAMERRK